MARRETLRLSFYATSGTFDAEHTGPTPTAGSKATSANVWHTGTQPGPAHLFVVLRDSRGGLDYWGSDAMVVKGRGT